MAVLPADLPSFRGRLVPRDSARVKAMVRHLREQQYDVSDRGGRVVRSRVPDADPATVAAACTACGGYCCRKGGDHGYFDGDDLVRIRRAQRLTVRELEAAYVAAIPKETYKDSCVFHGAQGCALPREMRSRVCNAYYCGSLERFLKEEVAARPQSVSIGSA
jgi:hypothetical protein